MTTLPLAMTDMRSSAVVMPPDEAAKYSPYEGASLCSFGKRSYDIFLRPNGTSGWLFGATCRSAAVAMACVNYVRRNRPYISVKMLPHGSAP